MSTELIQCIPNLSEGRNHKALDKHWQQLLNIQGLYCLNQHRDADHHRTVLTLAGHRNALTEAAHLLFNWSLQYIDLRNHQGVHPRMGAVDVFPMVPLTGISTKDTIVFSKHLANIVTQHWNVPCILYEKSVTPHADTEYRLPLIRKEWRKQAQKLTSQGACVMGVRDPLIAWNVWLKSNDLDTAKHIARVLREINGGFKGLRALGLPLPEKQQVQISMNLIDHKKSPLASIFKALQNHVKACDSEISHTEFIGLVPESALTDFLSLNTQLKSAEKKAIQQTHGLNSVLNKVSGKEFKDFFL